MSFRIGWINDDIDNTLLQPYRYCNLLGILLKNLFRFRNVKDGKRGAQIRIGLDSLHTYINSSYMPG